jgi:ubiquinone/menaquinone biosynthesis C-methylase UbiE
VADATKQKEASTRHFDQWATSYEEDATSRWLATLQDAAVEALALEARDRLLDVGCGTGAAVRRAAPEVERAIGVDLSPAMVARARELAAGLENVEFQEGDSERLPFGDGEFTAILCTTSFHHYPGPQRAVSEMARVLAPGGRVVIGDGCSDGMPARALDLVLRTFQSSHVHFNRSRELEAFFRGAGLSPTTRRWLAGRSYVIMAAAKPRAARKLVPSPG